MNMQASSSSQPGPEELERELRLTLYRFDCPDAHTLGEYQLEVLQEQQRLQIAAHAAQCDECRTELQTLRAFLALPTMVPESLVERARRVVAKLFVPEPGLAYSGLRGSADTSTQIFQAGDLTLTLGTGQTRGSVFGLLVSAGRTPEWFEGRAVTLTPREGSTISTSLDDVGTFEFAQVAAGQYALEIDLADGVVVVEELRVD
jgi:hypothetical protein